MIQNSERTFLNINFFRLKINARKAFAATPIAVPIKVLAMVVTAPFLMLFLSNNTDS